ncbi:MULTISPECIES: monovalent cation/H+ antiporter complex subunit F [unclassified Thioalkalivibrio]|uniref:monovalent cation/H+ antiporter complex subunit F n=1 Tax=unclassified Thioalkalivibrio TaxID=2621013 RepID=UPI0003807803|nr:MULTISPECIES: monovalent cation/H+ antiporter complex subunit F [unclassified Thioalkalivibrio]
MTDLFPFLVILLMLNIVVGLMRVLRGPTAADRMLAAEMFATSAIAIALLMAVLTQREALVDLALVFALLSALAVVTFVNRAWSGRARSSDGGDRP